MPEIEPRSYATSAGVEDAISSAAREVASRDASLGVATRIRLEHFRRFLSRVFSEGDDSEWVLKGGTGLLARVPSSRSTLDIDLYREGFTLTQALEDLVRLSSVDLADHFRFAYVTHKPVIGNAAQPYTEGYRVKFDVFVGLAQRGSIQVDLAVGAGTTDTVVPAEPANALQLPRLASHPYRLYPLVDQVADKVCATLDVYGSAASTREKDLVDLVVIATTHDLDGTALRIALTTETRRRRMEPFSRFAVPASWGAGYARLSRPVPHCTDHRTVDRASTLVARLIDPALSGIADGRTWSYSALDWT